MKKNELFDKCVKNVNPEVMEEVNRNIDKILVSEDLEQEIEAEYNKSREIGGRHNMLLWVNKRRLAELAHHFANWQKKQMMKDAVEGIARPDDNEIWVNLREYGYKFEDGDKVKIIIIKED